MATTHDFEGFAHAQAQRLGRTAWLLTGDHHAAEDLVQDTLTKLYVHGRESPEPTIQCATPARPC